MIGVSARSVDRWVFEGSLPKIENREKVNTYLNIEVFELD